MQWEVCLPNNWINTTNPDEECKRLSKLENLPINDAWPPVHVQFTVVVYKDGRWFVRACGHKLTPCNCALLESMPRILTPSDLPCVIEVLNCSVTCSGNYEAVYCELAESQKGVFKDSTSKVVRAKLYTTPFVLPDGSCCHSTIRTVKCDILIARERVMCTHCKAYRSVLRSLHRKKGKKALSRTEPSSKANWRYLSTPEKKERYHGRVTEVGIFIYT